MLQKHMGNLRHGFLRLGRPGRAIVLLLLVLVGVSPLLSHFASTAHAANYPFSVLPDDPLPTFTYKQFNVPQTDSPYFKIVPVTGQSFTTAIEATTPANITLPEDDSRQYAVTTQAPISQDVKKDDALKATFWLRQVSQPGIAQTSFIFERNGGDYAKSIVRTITPTTEWQQYQFIFRAVDDFAAGTAQVTFWLGYTQPQTIAFGGLTLSDLGPDAEVPAPTYEGRDPNAPWRTEAANRIDQYRKGNLNVTVRDKAGNIIPDANVHVQMLNHDFKFGSAVDAYPITDTGDPNNQIYREKIVQLFNLAVMENDTKWTFWEDVNWRSTYTLPAIKWLRDNGLTVRGHNLTWANPWGDKGPDAAQLESTPQALSNRIDNHIQNEVGLLRGQIRDWDVINELALTRGDSWAKALGGNDAIVHWFQLAHATDPKAQLAINDVPFFNNDGTPANGGLNYFKNLIAYMKSKNAPIDRLGVESHFTPDSLPSPENVMKVFDTISSFGVKPQATEFDLSTTDKQLQADFTRDYLTVLFSNPNVDTFLMWGFWDGMVWLPNTGLYDKEWNLKPNGQAYLDLLYKQWWTDVTGKTNYQGNYSTRAFTGDYQVDVTVNGKTNRVKTALTNKGKKLTVTFDPDAPAPTPGPTKPLPAPTKGTAPFVPDRGARLLNNGDAESGTGSWYCFGGCTVATDTTTVHSGTNSLLISNRPQFWQGPAQNLTGKVSSGNTYKSTVWARLKAGSAPTTLNASIKVQSDASPDAFTFPAGSAQVTADAWTQISQDVPITYPGTASTVEWWISANYGSDPVEFYIDDAQVSSPLAPRTIIANTITSLNGNVDGSIQQLQSANLTIATNAKITRGLYVPGTPLIITEGNNIAANELPSSGEISPSDKTITQQYGSQNTYLISRTDPVALPTITAPTTPQGTRDVVINQRNQPVGDATTLLNLTLNTGAGTVTVPAGTYGSFTVNSGTTLTLGVAGATEPAVYNLQNLSVNAAAKVNVVGPVIINLANGSAFNGTVGNSLHPLWLTLNVASGDVTVNTLSKLYGSLNIPGGNVTLNAGSFVLGRIQTNTIAIQTTAKVKDPSTL